MSDWLRIFLPFLLFLGVFLLPSPRKATRIFLVLLLCLVGPGWIALAVSSRLRDWLGE